MDTPSSPKNILINKVGIAILVFFVTLVFSLFVVILVSLHYPDSSFNMVTNPSVIQIIFIISGVAGIVQLFFSSKNPSDYTVPQLEAGQKRVYLGDIVTDLVNQKHYSTAFIIVTILLLILLGLWLIPVK